MAAAADKSDTAATPSPAARAEDKADTPPVQVEDDRAREQAAERAARRTPARLLRGPYLQCGTPQSLMVRWRTDKLSSSQVRFGLSETNLKFSARSRGLHTEHVVVLTNLLPQSRYFYALGTNTIGGTNVLLVSVTNSFVTAPVAGTAKATRVWVLGDSGTRQPTQKAVTAGFAKFNGERPIDLWLMLGDNAYNSGKDEEYQGSIFLAYPELLRKSVLWPAIGNHDGDQANSLAQSGDYYDTFTLPTQGQAGGVMSGTEAYYSFNYANAHFVCLDSYDSDRSTNGLMVRWLKSDLASNTQQWAVAYWHHPPYSKGGHDSDDDKDGDSRSREMREHIVPTLEAGGVDLVLCGHSHTYERTPLLDGHYGKSITFKTAFLKNAGDGSPESGEPYRKRTLGPAPHEGTVYVVAGSSGQISGVKGVHAAMLFALSVAGSLALDFDGPRLEASFVDTNGLRRDHFAIVKGPIPPARTNEPPFHFAALPFPATAPEQFSALASIPSSERETLLEVYRTTANPQFKAALIWTLAAMADARVAAELSGNVTNKVRDRKISNEEEQLRLTSLRALGLVAARYEPVTEILRKGLSADWWYFRTNYISERPQELSAADLQSCAIQALALSGRPEAKTLLVRGRFNYLDFTFGEPQVVFRNYGREFDRATNELAKARQMDPVTWRRQVLAAELEKLKRD